MFTTHLIALIPLISNDLIEWEHFFSIFVKTNDHKYETN